MGMGKLRPREDGASLHQTAQPWFKLSLLLFTPGSQSAIPGWVGWGLECRKGAGQVERAGRQLKVLAEQEPWMPQRPDGLRGTIHLLGGKGLKAPPVFRVPAQVVRDEGETENSGSRVPTALGK